MKTEQPLSATSRPPLPRLSFKPSHALRASLREGYGWREFRADLMAAVVVGTVALPLSMALAIASGAPPQYGLYTAIVAGGLIPLLGGSTLQVSGPTAAFVVLLAPVAHAHGLNGLMLATMLAGGLLVAMGVAGMGKLIEFIPYPVVTGFTAGIAVVIATLQLRDFFGLHVEHMPDHFLERAVALVKALPTVRLADTSVGVLTLVLLLLLPCVTRRVPAPLVALPVGAVVAWLLSRISADFAVETINSRFGGVPRALPHPGLPSLIGPDGAMLDLRALVGPAFAIGMLGAIESLLSAVVADGMTGRKHHPDAELFAQGIGNLVAPLFGGFAATGAVARTATNIRSGGRSPVAAVLHAVFILLAMVAFAPVLGYLPMASLAALLLVVAYNMSEVRHAVRVVRVAPRGDAVVLTSCFALTVIFDMVVSVSVGVVLAAMLFMRRMAELSSVRLVANGHRELTVPLPDEVLLYEISGPLFFGAAQKAVTALRSVGDHVRVIVLDMRAVPTMDATGLVNLESAIDALHAARKLVVLAGVQTQPLHLMAKAGWRHRPWVKVFNSFEDSVAAARDFVLTGDSAGGTLAG